jgi:uncharacterized membrane protein YidH (DUF202 family)
MQQQNYGNQVLIAQTPVFIPQMQSGGAIIQTFDVQEPALQAAAMRQMKIEQMRGKYSGVKALAIGLSVFSLLAAMGGFYPAMEETSRMHRSGIRQLPYFLAFVGVIVTMIVQLSFLIAALGKGKAGFRISKFLAPIVPTCFTFACISASFRDSGVIGGAIGFGIAGYAYGIFHFYVCCKLLKRQDKIDRLEKGKLL